ncbi:MAG: hypothetical protein LBS29_04695 [Endomicrobium sp.]|jgi:hypothetical protein|nr:hypothetical protein [Endomicrobium sp.]
MITQLLTTIESFGIWSIVGFAAFVYIVYRMVGGGKSSKSKNNNSSVEEKKTVV